MANIKIIKRRLKSVDNTRHITKAMEMIAASRILNAESRIKTFYDYAYRMILLIEHLSNIIPTAEHPLLDIHDEQKNAAVLMITSNRGLCGSYNNNVINKSEDIIKKLNNENYIEKLIVIGKSGYNYFKFRKRDIYEFYKDVKDQPSYADCKKLSNHLIDLYTKKEIDVIYIVFTHFSSALIQQTVVMRLLPIREIKRIRIIPGEFSIDGMLQTLLAKYIVEKIAEHEKKLLGEYIFEPTELELFKSLLPKYVETAVFYALLDSAASEHAARRVAMKNATDNAENIIDRLTRTYHALRQSTITSEIVEITQGAEAVKQHIGAK